MSTQTSPARPLSFQNNGGRASPFRRPESPVGRSPSTVRAATPQGSPLKNATSNPNLEPSSSTPSLNFSPGPPLDRSWLSSRNGGGANNGNGSPPTSPSRSRSPLVREDTGSSMRSLDTEVRSEQIPTGYTPTSSTSAATVRPLFSRSTTDKTVVPSSPSHPTSLPKLVQSRGSPSVQQASMPRSGDPLSAIPPQNLHTMRESFAVLDRNNSGAITAADVAAQLTELGLDASPAALRDFFPSSSSSSSAPISTLNLSSYLNLLATDLSALGRQDELLNAFTAFDTDDSGQIDVEDLMDSLLNLPPERPGEKPLSRDEIQRVMDGFVGKRLFSRGAVAMSAGFGVGGGVGNAAEKKKGDVFRYREFTGGIWGAGDANGPHNGVATAAGVEGS